ncbi:hypothetical protein D9758_008778 [Tetrapyrgos nigripes]|uniref:BTB domain-containing protein n=1 Tax=Tetrapyrgos nigripes TaxID=182062 RepID=A0A8H5D3T9_9AGAR|nr:hypothetical protein D9758_008778 [Tetrapyrgos nigripes]
MVFISVHADNGGDVIFCSSDDVRFYIRCQDLEYLTEGFPAGDQISSSEVVPLAEKASTLELLFQFTQRNTPLPDLDDVNFKQLMDLAEAAEKYVVHSAIRVCVMRMKDFLDVEHAEEIFNFAARHNGHESLIFAVAPMFVGKELEDVAYIMPADLYIPWSMYREQWLKILSHLTCPLDVFNPNSKKKLWRTRILAAKREIMANPQLIHHLEELIELEKDTRGPKGDDDMNAVLFLWRDGIVEQVKRMRTLKSFVLEHRQRKAVI